MHSRWIMVSSQLYYEPESKYGSVDTRNVGLSVVEMRERLEDAPKFFTKECNRTGEPVEICLDFKRRRNPC